MAAVEVNTISKRFKVDKTSVQALSDVSFTVNRGELFGIIGPDGAGKTTLFRILTTLMLADTGSARVDGRDVVTDFREIRKHVGYMPGKFSLYQDLTVEENLAFFATIFNTTIDANYELVKDIYSQIERFKTRKAGQLSGGMKQKLALSCALIHRPSVLFLDEPTTGVDAVSRKEFWELLRQLQTQGITILVSTPYMDEASLCDRVALIQDGKILDIDSPTGITKKFKHRIWDIRASNMYQLMMDLRGMREVASCFPFGSDHHLVLHDDAFPIETILERLRHAGHADVTAAPATVTIEDSFMALMNE